MGSEFTEAGSAHWPFMVLIAFSVEGREGEGLGERYARALGYKGTEELTEALVADPEEVRSRHGEAVLAVVGRKGMGLDEADDASARATLGRLYGRVPAAMWERMKIDPSRLATF